MSSESCGEVLSIIPDISCRVFSHGMPHPGMVRTANPVSLVNWWRPTAREHGALGSNIPHNTAKQLSSLYHMHPRKAMTVSTSCDS